MYVSTSLCCMGIQVLGMCHALCRIRAADHSDDYFYTVCFDHSDGRKHSRVLLASFRQGSQESPRVPQVRRSPQLGSKVRNQSSQLVGPAARVVPVEPHMGANWGPSSYKDYT